jgi:L-asparaginase
MSIRVIATGGTFDKQYDEIAGKLVFGNSQLPDVIARARITAPVALEILPLLDSLDMQDGDRQRILVSCTRAPERHIAIVHGTDTMRESAQVLDRAALDKTIVLTGAMIPYQIANSDALFNFGFAFGAAQFLPPGVYVAMNGQVFAAAQVWKDKEQGIFRSGADQG